MARSTRQPPSPTPAEDIPFEDAMGELETIVHAMEEERLPLDELVGKYERGMQLLRLCSDQIDSAKQRIELITASADGRATPVPFAPAAERPAAAPAPRTRPSSSVSDDHDDDEIRLF